jgi:hypothetical protein
MATRAQRSRASTRAAGSGESAGDAIGASAAVRHEISEDLIARRAFEISLTSTASAEENWYRAEAELQAELVQASMQARRAGTRA